ncbi:NAD(P)-dependent oxidoreductase [Arthrobacter sp. YN]|uniref:NAD(P)-dependent oxidoreductase n=1 Tax=Arthrobacter sp. YN TaxID=2020486 RepID=UPI0018DFEAEA|nr:NAD(P)-dependent oxidoreductase [Arthrobacter sp. YN]
MTERLLAAGIGVHGFDLSQEAAARLKEAGGYVYPSASEAAAASETIILMLPNSAVVASVLSELREAGALRAGGSVIDMSSSEPLRTIELAEELADLGVLFVDAPVSGGVMGAKSGNLSIMCGGNAESVKDLHWLWAPMGKAYAVGPTGAGHAAKALNNLLSASHFLLTSEAVALTTRLGIDPGTFIDVINHSSGRSGSSEVKWPKFVLTETYNSGFDARLMVKDVAIAVNLAKALGLRSATAEAVADSWSQILDELPPNADHTEVARYVLERATLSTTRATTE